MREVVQRFCPSVAAMALRYGSSLRTPESEAVFLDFELAFGSAPNPIQSTGAQYRSTTARLGIASATKTYFSSCPHKHSVLYKSRSWPSGHRCYD